MSVCPVTGRVGPALSSHATTNSTSDIESQRTSAVATSSHTGTDTAPTVEKPPAYYGDYLHLKDLLNCQAPRTNAHDEMLFITTHQVYELLFKQVLHEVDSVRTIFSQVPVDERDMGVAVSRLNRVRAIQEPLLQMITVLETMTPAGFLSFRDALHPASGFQSVQFRLLENALGLQPTQRLQYGFRGLVHDLAPVCRSHVRNARPVCVVAASNTSCDNGATVLLAFRYCSYLNSSDGAVVRASGEHCGVVRRACFLFA